MLTTYAILVLAIVIIYFSCEFFVNSIEWVGKKFNIARSAVGCILAALGTAIPESAVTLVAVAFNATAEQKDIGVGAALAGPLVLATISYAVIGLAIISYQKRNNLAKHLDIDNKKLRRDQLWFISIFIFKVALGLVVFDLKQYTSILFIFAYAVYFIKEMSVPCDDEEIHLEPLKFRPNCKDPAKFWVLLQTAISLVFIFIGSHIFVEHLELISIGWGISPVIVSLLLSPLATELPEILNTVIWVRQGKASLALCNISGAMMIQATIPSAFGIYFTPWLFNNYLISAGIATLLSIMFLSFVFKKDKLSPIYLVFAGVFYLLFCSVFFI